MNTYRIPIKNLFEILEIDDIEYEKPTKVSVNVKIKSQNGFVPVNAFIKKKHKTAEYVFENTSIKCSTNHLVFSEGKPKKIKDCSIVDSINGTLKVEGIIEGEIEEVYDVSLDAPHEYVTPNGIIHHNTTLAKILLNELDVQSTDVLFANGSKEGRKIEWVDKLISFCQTMSFGEFKVVVIDEADYTNLHSVQPALRNVMEEYVSGVRFILTCNYPNKLMPAIHSRCQHIHFEKLDVTEFTAKMAEILIAENVEFTLDVLDSYVKTYYPDLRKCINTAQLNSKSGSLSIIGNKSSSADYRLEMTNLFKEGKIQEARTLLCSQVQPEEIDDIFRWLYTNIELFGNTQEQQDDAVLVIKQGLVDHAIVADPEINLSAVLIQLSRIKAGK